MPEQAAGGKGLQCLPACLPGTILTYYIKIQCECLSSAAAAAASAEEFLHEKSIKEICKMHHCCSGSSTVGKFSAFNSSQDDGG